MESSGNAMISQQAASAPVSSNNVAGEEKAVPAGEQPVKKSKPDTTPRCPVLQQHNKCMLTARFSDSASALKAIPTSAALLSARLKKEVHAIWSTEHCAADAGTLNTANKTIKTTSVPSSIDVIIPPFKVGTLEMYRRFPQAYDLLMQHHNCSAVQTALLHDIIGRIERTAATSSTVHAPSSIPKTQAGGTRRRQQPWIRVADFGCGTGRIETIVAQHEAVRAIYAYDSEVAMLKQCLLNTVRTAAQSKHYSGVLLYPIATVSTSSGSSSAAVSTSSTAICGTRSTSDKVSEEESSVSGSGTSNSDSLTELELCIRPVPFQAVSDGFLATTFHPRCSLMVCAWSLSYVMRMQWGEDHWHAAVDSVVQAMLDHLDTSSSDAALVILETLGNGSAEPTRQNTYTQRLEEHFGFTRTWVRTDYEFASRADAERMVRFFFGEKMLAKVTMDDSGVKYRLMECTGIWTLWKTRQQ